MFLCHNISYKDPFGKIPLAKNIAEYDENFKYSVELINHPITKNKTFLKEIVNEFKSYGIRTSIFLDPNTKFIESVCEINPDRVELYTEEYAREFPNDNLKAINKYSICAKEINDVGIGVNAGHDLSLKNIKFFKQNIDNLLEVSIGHALITESLYFGLERTIKSYLDYLS